MRTISWDDGMMIQWKVPGLPSTEAGPEAVHSASFKLGWKEKVKLKQLAEATSRCTTSFALKQTRVSGAACHNSNENRLERDGRGGKRELVPALATRDQLSRRVVGELDTEALLVLDVAGRRDVLVVSARF